MLPAKNNFTINLTDISDYKILQPTESLVLFTYMTNRNRLSCIKFVLSAARKGYTCYVLGYVLRYVVSIDQSIIKIMRNVMKEFAWND